MIGGSVSKPLEKVVKWLSPLGRLCLRDVHDPVRMTKSGLGFCFPKLDMKPERASIPLSLDPGLDTESERQPLARIPLSYHPILSFSAPVPVFLLSFLSCQNFGSAKYFFTGSSVSTFFFFGEVFLFASHRFQAPITPRRPSVLPPSFPLFPPLFDPVIVYLNSCLPPCLFVFSPLDMTPDPVSNPRSPLFQNPSACFWDGSGLGYPLFSLSSSAKNCNALLGWSSRLILFSHPLSGFQALYPWVPRSGTSSSSFRGCTDASHRPLPVFFPFFLAWATILLI